MADADKARTYSSMRRRFDRNLIVIGAGAAGLVAAYTAAAAGARVSLVERERMGGDCLNTGCVPSKALIHSARFLADLRRPERFGVRSARAEFDFADVMQRVRDVVRRVEPHDSERRYRALGVDCIRAEARVISPHEVDVGRRRLTTRAVLVATGARPLVPPVPGLEAVDYLTSETLWDLEQLPERLLVVGGGPIGCEMGQSFARLGSQVTLVDMADRLLAREDDEVSEAMKQALAADGVDLCLGCRLVAFTAAPAGAGRVVLEKGGERETLEFDRVLVAAGRKADVEALGLQELGVKTNPDGTLHSDDRLRTSVKGIYAAGDVTGPFQLTHAAGRQGWYAAMNALYGGLWRFRIDYRVMPQVVYTDPEVARVGLNRQQAVREGVDHHVTRYGLEELDRAIADSVNEGFVEVLTAPRRDRILGATLVGPRAGDLVGQFTAAMQGGYGLKRLLGTIQPYPTYAEAPVLLAGRWRREHLPAWALTLSRALLDYRCR